MPPSVEIAIEAVNRVQRTYQDIERQNAETTRAIQRAWQNANRLMLADTARFARENQAAAVDVRTGWTRQIGIMERAWRGFINASIAGVNRLGRAMRGIGRISMGGVRGLGRFATSTTGQIAGLSLGGGLAFGVQRGVSLAFEQQRQQALFRTTRSPRERGALNQFIDAQAGGAFNRRQVQAAVTEGQRLDATSLQRLIIALRGAAAASGDLAGGVNAVQKAMFEGEAELAERFGLLLREKNLVIEAQRAYGTTVGRLTDEQKARVVLNVAMEQASRLRSLEGEILKTSAGRWLVLKNRIDEVLISLGTSMEPVIRRTLDFLEKPIENMKVLGAQLANFFKALWADLKAFVDTAVDYIFVRASNLNPLKMTKTPLPAVTASFSATAQAASQIGSLPQAQQQQQRQQLTPPAGQVFTSGQTAVFSNVPDRTDIVRRARLAELQRMAQGPLPEAGAGDFGQQMQQLSSSLSEAGNNALMLAQNVSQAFSQIASVTDNMALQITAVIINMLTQILSIASSSSSGSSLLNSVGIGGAALSATGIGLAAVGAGVAIAGVVQAHRAQRNNVRRAPRAMRTS